MSTPTRAAKPSHARRQLITAAAAAPLAALSPLAWAQSDYPNRALRVIVPQPPGGGFDFVARTLAEPLGKALGQGVAVENRTGSGTLVGTEAAAKAAADGYTLLTGSVSNMVLNMGLYKNLPYDALRDFEPVGLAVSYSYTLLGRNGLPFNDLAGLLAYAKANPGKLSYASAGNGSGQHVIAAALWKQAGVELVHVPYRGAQPAYTDLLGDRVDLFFDLTPTTRAHVDTGKLKALATSGKARNPLQASVPTITESGVPLELESWFGYFAPSKTPPAVLEKLRSELAKIIASPEIMETFRKAGGAPMNISVADTRSMLARDVQRWTGLIRAANISLD
jgi:tripartite-type tricarboxylate transporter receptor subunit TctC